MNEPKARPTHLSGRISRIRSALLVSVSEVACTPAKMGLLRREADPERAAGRSGPSPGCGLACLRGVVGVVALDLADRFPCGNHAFNRHKATDFIVA